ncbi:HAD-IIA family hydrolase [Trebonia sp.]|uniref:HAD-IIA family hydrolase n=1 Tax=Trebonia sp. TaxID=2767075 RepID=UPI00260D928C|nr:HAD-IIA family hydrolase [Trebonia sp.]
MPNLHEQYDVALLDLDGVVYIGGAAIPGAPEALQHARRQGMRLAYVTNNASRTPAAVAALLKDMHVPAHPDDVVTSAQAAARLLADKLPPAAPVLVIGSTALRLAVRERGLRPVSTAAERPLAVVQGYGPGIEYGSLAEGGLAVRAGALFVGTNADSTLPGPRGTQPGNGSLLQVIAHATGTAPLIAGKPEPPLHRESVIRTGAKNPLVVGDRLDTDIEAAYRAGAHSMLVLTGVSRPADLLLAPPRLRPTYVAATLDALLRPYPQVARHDEGFTCGGWNALRQASGQLALTGTGAAIDGLRALCEAAWDATGATGATSATRATREPLTARDVDAALAELGAAGLRM